jgi:hypothetical protein
MCVCMCHVLLSLHYTVVVSRCALAGMFNGVMYTLVRQLRVTQLLSLARKFCPPCVCVCASYMQGFPCDSAERTLCTVYVRGLEPVADFMSTMCSILNHVFTLLITHPPP